MKICSKCFVEKEKEDFPKRAKAKDGLNVWCKVCFKDYNKNLEKTYRNSRKAKNNKKYRLERYDIIKKYLIGKTCLICKESDPVVLEFDHRDRSSKEFAISEGITRSWDQVKEELEKCDVLCANCHRRKTAKEMGWHK